MEANGDESGVTKQNGQKVETLKLRQACAGQ